MKSLNLVVVVCSEEDWYESEPDDTGRVHCEPNILRFIEVFYRKENNQSISGKHDKNIFEK